MNEPNQGDSPIDASLAAPPPTSPATADAASRTSEIDPGSDPGHASQLGRASVFVILFLGVGALGLPLLWINRNFSTTERVVWTIIVLLYTVALFAFFAWFVWRYAYQPLFG